MGSFTRSQFGFFTLGPLSAEGTIGGSCIMQKYVSFGKSSFPAAEQDAHVGIEEKLLIRHVYHLGYLPEIELAGKTYFNGGNGLVETAIIETHGALGINPRLDAKRFQPTVKPSALATWILLAVSFFVTSSQVDW